MGGQTRDEVAVTVQKCLRCEEPKSPSPHLPLQPPIPTPHGSFCGWLRKNQVQKNPKGQRRCSSTHLTAVPVSYHLSSQLAPALRVMRGAPLLVLTPARRNAAGLAAEHHTSMSNLSAFMSRASRQGSELGGRAPEVMRGREGVWIKKQKPLGLFLTCFAFWVVSTVQVCPDSSEVFLCDHTRWKTNMQKELRH